MGGTIHTLIVGGTRGLGKALASYLSDAGHSVSCLSKKNPKERIHQVQYVHADIRDRRQVKNAFQLLRAKRGPITNIVLTQRFRGKSGWEGEMDTTVNGSRHVIELFGEGKPPAGASVVVISSNGSRYFVDDQPAEYHASKAALEQLVRFYAVKLGTKKIRVNAIAPCSFVKEESRAYYAKNKKLQSFYRDLTPLGRMITTDDVAYLTGALLDSACALTGQTIVLDGGVSLLWPENVFRAAIKK